MVQSFSLRNLFCIMSLLVITLGCNKQTAESQGQKESDADNNSVESKTTVVSPASTSGATSPANEGNKLDINSDPDEVCTAFLDALVANDLVVAERYLTYAAKVQTRNAQLELQAPGSTKAKYQIMEPKYATSKKLSATVDCEISDKFEGEDTKYVVTWLLQLKKTGWKISGMMFKIHDSDPIELLSFENAHDVQRIKAAVNGESATDVRTASDPLQNDIK